MIDYKNNLMGCSVLSRASYPALVLWLQVITASSGLALLASPVRAQSQPTAPEAAVHTSAQYLLVPQSQAERGSAPERATAPETPSTKPEFSNSGSAPSGPSPSPRANQSQMQTPAPPPSIVSQAPAPVPYLEQLLGPAGSAAGAGSEAASGDTAPTYNSVFVDPTDYSLGATAGPDSPSLVFSERSSGCEVTVAAGEMEQSCGSGTSQVAEAASGGVQVGPVNVSRQGVSVGNVTVVSREFLNEKLRPLNVLRRGLEEYVFPLSIPAPITSLFGWRVHPIYGDHRFHSGTDLAAPMGTPVLASRAGRVAVADSLGGYGLTVILRHGDGDIESRYAHLSRIAVRPGEWIEQGEVIGLVGSTGNSTGPHLHFEVRQLTAQGWIAMDAGQILQHGMANLIEVINNPLQAMARTGEVDAEAAPLQDYPYRPAQPNAS